MLTEQLGIATDPDTGTLPEALPGGRQLLLSSDFYTVYECLGRIDGVEDLWCWAHIRRYFIRAADAHSELAAWTAAWVERIAERYLAHTAITAAEVASSTHRMAVAQFRAALNTVDAERAAQTRRPELLPPAAAKVLATLDREWDGLAHHREFPELALDNNTPERALRGPVIGRRNYYGSGSVISAEISQPSLDHHSHRATGLAQPADLPHRLGPHQPRRPLRGPATHRPSTHRNDPTIEGHR